MSTTLAPSTSSIVDCQTEGEKEVEAEEFGDNEPTITRNQSSASTAIVKVYPQFHHFPEMLDSLKPETDFSAPLLGSGKGYCLQSCCRPTGGGPMDEEACMSSNYGNCKTPNDISSTGHHLSQSPQRGNSTSQSHRRHYKSEDNPASDESSPLSPRKHPYAIVSRKALDDIETGTILSRKEGK